MSVPTIMIVDDDPANLRVLGTMLSRQGYTVRSFPSGSAALQSAKTEPPDLIMLDILMPGMDGFEVCHRLKANDGLRAIPVIFLSAVDKSEEKVRAFELGGVDYITKPFQVEEVLARVKTHITLREATRGLERLNIDLQQRVQERTTQLLESNLTLEEQIEERLAAEHALRASEEQYRRIVTTANEGIATTDETFRITYANKVMAELLGGAVEDIIGRKNIDFVHEEDREAVRSRYRQRTTGKYEVYECRIKRLDHQTIWVMVSAAPIMDPGNQFVGSVVMFTDITDRKQAETKLRNAYQEISKLKQQIEADNIYLQEEIKLEHNFDQIIGNSDEIKYALFRLEQVAKTDSAVIILGETGTGKELFARALHSTSTRAARPLIKVNCATLSEQFIESELFGHVKGAFTDAIKDRQGRFELANGGTVFLDEIGELPSSLQAKLLRVLQDGEFEKLGDSRTMKTDVRVIVATNRDLKELVRAGKFREDLWYRLNVFPITIPALRDRKDDIPLLADHFVKKIGKKIGKEVTHISKTVLDDLMAYDWPGNVRELEHVIERSIITSPGNGLHLSERLVRVSNESRPEVIKSHADMERQHIVRVLEQTNWVIQGPKGAAKILEIHPNTLRYRMQKLGIRRPES